MAVDFNLHDRIALVTGASRGIGEAIAHALAESGAHCILVSRKAEALAEVAGAIAQKGGRAEVMPCNTGDVEQIGAMFREVEERHGRLDILVNNAATNPFFGQMTEAEPWAWDKTFEVNLRGPFFLCQHAARLMKKKPGGAIVNVSSVNGVRPAPFQGIYSITKAGLISMTKAFAKELGPFNIRVNALLPGITDTKFASVLIENKDILKAALAQVPLGRCAMPEEMAGAVLFLVSDAGSYVTGSCVTCDGGMLA